MANATVNYFGSANDTSPVIADQRELFLKLFSNDVITAFDETRTMKGRIRERTITSGKSSQFIVSGKTSGQRHYPGVERKGSNSMAQAEREIFIDYPLSTDIFLSRFDEALSHWDGRSEISNQMGQYLANRWDEDALTQVVLAARAAAVLTSDEPAGNSDIDADADTVASSLLANFWAAAQYFDENDVPWRGKAVAHLAPAQYYLIAQTPDVYNADYTNANEGTRDDGKVKMYAGVPIIMTNHLPRTNRSAEAGGEQNNYAGDFTNNVMTIHTPEAVGAVKLWDVTSYVKDQRAERGGTLLVSELACGMGVLRPGAAYEVKTA